MEDVARKSVYNRSFQVRVISRSVLGFYIPKLFSFIVPIENWPRWAVFDGHILFHDINNGHPGPPWGHCLGSRSFLTKSAFQAEQGPILDNMPPTKTKKNAGPSQRTMGECAC